jgi:hypothetical protein
MALASSAFHLLGPDHPETMKNKTTVPKSKVRSTLSALSGRNVHLETKGGDIYHGMLLVLPDGVSVGTNPLVIDIADVRNVREV